MVNKASLVSNNNQIFYPIQQESINANLTTQLKNMISPNANNDTTKHNNNHPSVLGD